MPVTLGPQFWDKLTKISNSVNLSPEDLLAVMYFESGLNPSIHSSKGEAAGLIQFMPDTLKGLGFHGDLKDFRRVDAIDQLDYVSKYMHNQAKFNGGGFKSLTQYYVANFWPVALKLPGVQQEDPRTVIVDSNPTTQRYPGVSLSIERAAYKANSVLDHDHDGKITYGDLQTTMQGVKKSPEYQNAVAKLSSGQEFSVGEKAPSSMPRSGDSFFSNLDSMLTQFMSAVADLENSNRLNKKAQYKSLPENNIMIKLESNDVINSLEFARILCSALDEEAQAMATIYTDRHTVEVLCKINGPHRACRKAVAQLCIALEDAFKLATKKVGGIEVRTFISPNEKPSYQELDIKLALSAYRQFQLKFIK